MSRSPLLLAPVMIKSQHLLFANGREGVMEARSDMPAQLQSAAALAGSEAPPRPETTGHTYESDRKARENSFKLNKSTSDRALLINARGAKRSLHVANAILGCQRRGVTCKFQPHFFMISCHRRMTRKPPRTDGA